MDLPVFKFDDSESAETKCARINFRLTHRQKEEIVEMSEKFKVSISKYLLVLHKQYVNQIRNFKFR